MIGSYWRCRFTPRALACSESFSTRFVLYRPGTPHGTRSLAGHGYPIFASAHGLNIQSDQSPLGPGEVANDFLDGRRQPSHQGWNGDDLIALCQLRLLEQVDDFNTILALQLI